MGNVAAEAVKGRICGFQDWRVALFASALEFDSTQVFERVLVIAEHLSSPKSVIMILEVFRHRVFLRFLPIP
jgi:hypothetical protein